MKFASGIADPEARACARWKTAAGKNIAEHTKAVSLVRGKLVIEVDDIVWQRQLNTLRYFLLRNLERELGEALVMDLDFRPMPKKRRPQVEQTARPVLSDDPGHIVDPVLRGLYRETVRKKA